MSKHFPGSARKYDLYVASPEELRVGRVLFAGGGRRFVIKEAYPREEWEKEREVRPADPDCPRVFGITLADDKPVHVPPPLATEAPPVTEDFKYFYGADYL